MNEKILYGIIALGLIASFVTLFFSDMRLNNAITVFLTAILVGSTLYYASATKEIAGYNEDNVNLIKKSLSSDIIIKLRETYATDDMLDGMKRIKDWIDNAKRRNEDYFEKYVKLKNSYDKYKILDRDRRKLSHYLHTIYTLKKYGNIDDDFVKIMVQKRTIEFLKNYIDPMERVLVDYETACETFNYFYELYDIEY